MKWKMSGAAEYDPCWNLNLSFCVPKSEGYLVNIIFITRPMENVVTSTVTVTTYLRCMSSCVRTAIWLKNWLILELSRKNVSFDDYSF